MVSVSDSSFIISLLFSFLVIVIGKLAPKNESEYEIFKGKTISGTDIFFCRNGE